MSDENPIVIAPASVPQEQALNSTSDITLYGGSAGCFDADTEFMGEHGWIKFSEYVKGTKVAQYNVEEDLVSFVEPLDYIKLPQSSFKRIQARGLDFCLSPEHRVLYWPYDKPNVITYSEVISRHEKSKTKGWTGKIKTTFKVSNIGIDLSEGEIRLQVAAQADGRFVREGKDNYCQMRFAKERKYDRLLELCKKFNLRFDDRGFKPCDRYKSGKAFEVIVWPQRATKLYTNDWWKCSQEQLETIVDEVAHWDASDLKNKSGTIRYFTNHKINADFIQYAFHACGYNTSISRDDETYTVNASLTGNGFRGFANKDGKAEVEDYQSVDGFKYCFSVPSEYLLVRRNNKVFLSGNSGKTYTLLITALRFMMVPRSTGIIFRRTSKMLDAPGSIWSEAVSMYSTIFPKIRIRHREHEIIFDNDSILKFSHMQYESNAYDHKGGQYSFVAFDEATDFTETQVTFLLSRMRNANVSYTPQMYLCTNPDYNSFLREWIQDFYLDPVDGTPIAERSNVERYFVKQGNAIKWFDKREDAEAIHGKGNASGIRSFRFCSAKIWDNPFLRDTDYLSNLMALDRVQRLIMLEGSWTARMESAGYWHRNNVEIVENAPTDSRRRVLGVDLAFSRPTETIPDPDSSAFVLMSKGTDNVYTVEHVHTMQDRVHAVEAKLFELAATFGRDVTYCIPCDPNAQAGAYARDLQRRMAEKGFTCKLQKPVKSKLVRFQPFASVTEAKFVRIVRGDWNKDYFDQLEIFDGMGKHHDDMVDATSDAFLELNKGTTIPTMSLSSINISPSPNSQSFLQTYNQNSAASFSLPTFNIR